MRYIDSYPADGTNFELLSSDQFLLVIHLLTVHSFFQFYILGSAFYNKLRSQLAATGIDTAGICPIEVRVVHGKRDHIVETERFESCRTNCTAQISARAFQRVEQIAIPTSVESVTSASIESRTSLEVCPLYYYYRSPRSVIGRTRR